MMKIVFVVITQITMKQKETQPMQKYVKIVIIFMNQQKELKKTKKCENLIYWCIDVD